MFNYQSSCIAHQATCLFYPMSKCLSTTFLFFLISYFQTAYESVLFRVVPADSLYIISPLPLSVNNFFTIISYLKMSTLKSTFFRVFIVLPFCTIRSLFYCIFSLLGSAVVRLPLLPASHAPCIRCYASCFTSSLNNSPAEW